MITNWEEKKIGEVIKLEYGKPLPKPKRKPDGLYPAYGANGIKARTDEFYYAKPSIIVGRKGSAGEVNFSEPKFWPLDVTYFVTFDEGQYDLRFLYYLLKKLELPKLAKGVKPGINRNDVYSIDTLFPPLAEQQRIVEILDQAFAAITTARAHAEQNLTNARELFESYLQGVFANPGEDWAEKTLGDVCLVQRGSSPRPIKNYLTEDENGVNWIKIGDTKGVAKYIRSTKQKITAEGATKSRFVKEGDLLLSNSMSYGKPYIMKTQGYIHDGWFVLRPNDSLNLDYFWYLLFSSYVREQFDALASGSVVKNIRRELVHKANLPIPPIHIQQGIVKKFDEVFTKTKKLEAIYTQKIAALDELKQSLLQKAFAGELTKEFT